MADIRIKDLATTATTTASDDFMAVDGAINGTRKLSAATPAFLTSVTTPSLTSPAATNLTLAGGAGNSSIILTPAGTGNVGIGTTTPASFVELKAAAGILQQRFTDITAGLIGFIGGANGILSGAAANTMGVRGENGLFLSGAGNTNTHLVLNSSSQVLIGTTDATGLTGAGGLKIASTTAGSSGAGALVVQGGISAAGASYFGGAVTVTGGLTASSWSLLGAGVWPTTAMGQSGSRVVNSSATENQLFTILNMNTAASGAVGINYGASIYLGARGTDNTADMAIAEIFGARESATSGNLTSYLSFKTSNSIGARTEALRLASTGAATFAGAVTIGGNVGFYNASPVAKPTGVAVTAAAIHAALVTLNLIAA